MKVLFVAAEVTPLAKTGGLADVAGTLPKALRQLGIDVRIVLPAYPFIEYEAYSLIPSGQTIEVRLGNMHHTAEILSGLLDEVPIYLVKCPSLFDRRGIYAEPGGGEYGDNLWRFSFFSASAFALMKSISFYPDIVHANDWHTALIPGLQRAYYAQMPEYQQMKTLYTIHNLGYQGEFTLGSFWDLGFESWLGTSNGYEFYGKTNLMKGGVLLADAVNTVSPNYAQEILSQEYGFGLDGILASTPIQPYGILNGIDNTKWDPSADSNIPVPYSSDNFSAKLQNKLSIQRAYGLPLAIETPLIGMVARLTDQKGCHILLQALRDILPHNCIQIILLGTGENHFAQALGDLAHQFPDKIQIKLRFDEKLSHQIYAGADIFLIPSCYEPCGLSQMISFRYGTVPVARATGGLVDTIIDQDSEDLQNGFLFRDYSGPALVNAIHRSIEIYTQQPERWQKIALNGMKADFSWKRSAQTYAELYEKLVKN